jgi:hypothetical protein
VPKTKGHESGIKAGRVPFIALYEPCKVKKATLADSMVIVEEATWGKISDMINFTLKTLASDRPGAVFTGKLDDVFYHQPLPKDVVLYFSQIEDGVVGVVVLHINNGDHTAITSAIFTLTTSH